MKQAQSFKKLFLTFMFFFISSEQITAKCCSSVFNSVGLGKYWELTEKYYPKSVAYFENLRQKYHVLTNIAIILWDGPCADNDTIYFSIKWIEKLEKGNKFYLDATEWIILHEAGHIHHNDILKMSFANLGIWTSILISYNLTHDDKKLAFTSLALLLTGITAQWYMMLTREYAADDFAMLHCNNPQAWIAAYEYLDRFAPLGYLPSITHSFTKYRLKRISKVFQEKFGYELIVIPQSLKPEYVAD